MNGIAEIGGGANTDILPVMLLLLVTMTVSAIICMFSVLYYLRNRRAAQLVSAPLSGKSRYSSMLAVPRFVFDRPRCWIAIQSRNLHLVQETLGLVNPTSCSWMEGLAEVCSENRIFVSAPIKGWILVFGPHLPRPSDDVDHCYSYLRALSEKLGEVHYFCGDSVTYEHAWARLVDGVVIRAYAWYRETLWNQGKLSEAEQRVRMEAFPYGESPDPFGLGSQERFRKNTERIFGLANRWSLDPSRIGQAELVGAGLGVSGDVSQARIS